MWKQHDGIWPKIVSFLSFYGNQWTFLYGKELSYNLTTNTKKEPPGKWQTEHQNQTKTPLKYMVLTVNSTEYVTFSV